MMKKNCFQKQRVLLAILLLSSSVAQAAFDGETATPVGIHTGFIRGWGGTPHFCDFLKMEDRNWVMSGPNGSKSSVNGALDWVYQELNPALINSNGYPVSMPSGTFTLTDGSSAPVPSGAILFATPGRNSTRPALESYLGRYVLSWEGDADIRLSSDFAEYVSGDAPTGVLHNGSRVYTMRDIFWLNGLRVEVRGLGSQPITDLRLSMPDPSDPWNKSLETGTFHPTFLDRLADRNWAFIRIMNLISTDRNPQVNWSDRRQPNHCFQEGVINTRTPAPADFLIWKDPNTGVEYYPTPNRPTGMSFEYMVELCNTTGIDLWLSTPHMVTDDFLNKLAKLVAYGSDGINPYDGPQSNPIYPPLNTNLNVYLEFSNELWQWPNDSFPQTIWAKAEADAAGILVPIFTAQQASRVWGIFESYLPSDRVHRVAAVHAANAAPGSYTQLFMDAFYDVNLGLLKPEIISPATYFGNNIQQWVFDNHPNLPAEETNAYWSSSQYDADLAEMFKTWKKFVFTETEYGANSGPDTVGTSGGFDQEIQNIAQARGLEIIGYEGGPSIYTDSMKKIVDGEITIVYDPGTTFFMNEANRRDGIAELYRIHMNQGLERGIRTHSLFTLTGGYSRHGQWGHLEYLMQDPNTAPKYTFMKNWFDSASTLNNIDHSEGSRPSFTTDAFLALFELGTDQSETIGYDQTAVSVEEISTLLPAGLTFDLNSMTISGTPTETGKGYIYLMLKDADGDPAWRLFEVTVLEEVLFGPDATLTFESVPEDRLGEQVYNETSYTEAGYTLTVLNGDPFTLDILGPELGFESKVLQGSFYNSRISLTAENPDHFLNISSFDYAAGPYANLADATVTGYFITGEERSFTISSSTKSMVTKTLDGWNGLIRIEFNYQGGASQDYGTLDNFILTHGSGYTYDTWKNEVSWGGMDSSENGNPDGDRINNYWEYAMDLNPLVADASPFVISTDPTGPYFHFDYRRNKLATDLIWSLRASSNLVSNAWITWPVDDVTVFSETLDLDIDGDGSAELMRYRILLGSEKSRFFRLGIE